MISIIFIIVIIININIISIKISINVSHNISITLTINTNISINISMSITININSINIISNSINVSISINISINMSFNINIIIVSFNISIIRITYSFSLYTFLCCKLKEFIIQNLLPHQTKLYLTLNCNTLNDIFNIVHFVHVSPYSHSWGKNTWLSVLHIYSELDISYFSCISFTVTPSSSANLPMTN